MGEKEENIGFIVLIRIAFALIAIACILLLSTLVTYEWLPKWTAIPAALVSITAMFISIAIAPKSATEYEELLDQPLDKPLKEEDDD